jgi:hypothetical protein
VLFRGRSCAFSYPRETSSLILYCELDVKLLEQIGQKYCWPRPRCCPRCQSRRLWGHGYVRRYFDECSEAVCLRRYRCPDCGAVHTLRPHSYDRRFQVIWFTIFWSLLRKITLGHWLRGISRQRQQYWWKGFQKHASRTQNTSSATALGSLVSFLKADHLLGTHSLTYYERTSLGEPPHRRFAATFPCGVG